MSAPHPSAPTPSGSTPGGNRPAQPSFLEWLPWEKFLIWGLFLLAVYALRDFFLIIFMTFILTYIMRSVVRRMARTVSPARERVWLERALTVICFGLLLLGLYGAGLYVGPKLSEQAEALINRVTILNPEEEFNGFITKTVGALRFQKKYSGRDDPHYVASFEKFQNEERQASTYESFPELEDSLERRFEEAQKQRIREELKLKSLSDKDLEEWFIREKAPDILAKDRDRLVKRWEEKYEEASRVVTGVPPLEELRKREDFERTREEAIWRMIYKDRASEPEQKKALQAEWSESTVGTALTALKSSSDYERLFQQFYERERTSPLGGLSERIPYDYGKFIDLRNAHTEGEAAFARVLNEGEGLSDEDLLERAHVDFEYRERRALADEWMRSPATLRIRDALLDYLGGVLKSTPAWVRDAVGYILWIPVQVTLCFLLSLFITWDVPKLRRGILRLRRSRVRDVFDEIAPGLFNFGRLIGRAFQAQGIIALFNTLLTFIAITLLGIRNEVFLCSIVFVCSFIPVVGVVLSSVPIAIVAIVQRDGSIFLALKAIGAILLVHFFETSVLNPKILGDMLHLHPVIVLAVLAIGEHFFGVWGLLLGVPVAVYIIRCVILNEEIPGLIEQTPLDDLEGYGEPPRPPPRGGVAAEPAAAKMPELGGPERVEVGAGGGAPRGE